MGVPGPVPVSLVTLAGTGSSRNDSGWIWGTQLRAVALGARWGLWRSK